ncbi:MAG: response regulator, partial [Proteobacteria bacterium]|nr:response regulator [Pseudomonadota bacterium]
LRSHENLAHIPVVIVSILAEDNSSKGISLGAAKVLQKPVDNDELIAALSEVTGLGMVGGQGAKVLVADDDPKAVELVSLHLEKRGFEVLRAYGGEDAIDLAVSEKPALILLDLMMPEVTGFDVVKELASRKDTAQIPIVILTAKDITREDREILKGGISRIVNKSDFNKGNFISEVRRAMQSGISSASKSIAG